MPSASSAKEIGRLRRHRRVRKRVAGTSERPRLSVHRSSLHTYAQLVDDLAGKTLLNGSTRNSELRKAVSKGSTVVAAKKLGEWIGEKAQSAGIKKVVFDRGGYLFHGRVRALAEGARSKGLEF